MQKGTGGSDDKESPCNAGDLDSIHGSVRSPGEGNGMDNSISKEKHYAHCHGQINYGISIRVMYQENARRIEGNAIMFYLLKNNLLENIFLPWSLSLIVETALSL